ncbi:MAG TPA: hypothetical protein VGQ42_12265 [Candidatus Dormibacteraeota bacterium]|jgi:hypothetical protein|nr:hypothetical protein [Candidatus Dormibacteraeota bacterium]
MSWIGVESADEPDRRARSRATRAALRRDWVLRTTLSGRTIEARLVALTEGEAHAYARKLSERYSLHPATER